MMKPSLLIYAAILVFGFTATAFGLELQVEETYKIWDNAPTNAFTDLTLIDGKFICVFREGTAHVSPDGSIRVLQSTDLKNWQSLALIQKDGYDLRDPKITLHPDGKTWLIYGGAAVREGKQPATSHQSFVVTSTDGLNWSPLIWAAAPSQWLWRVTWFNDAAYGIAYNVSPQSRAERRYGTTLLKSDDGKTFTELVPSLFGESGPTEATLRFAEDGTCYCLQRRDGKEGNTALLGTSQPPYKEWSWKDLGRYFGGPDFIQIPSGEWIASGRFHTDDGSKTVVCLLDVENGSLEQKLTLPSGGDTSYPGMLWHDGKLIVSYYSSHEGKTSIYLSTILVK
ncbi:MAG: hypothetical protein P9L94_05665 [Candidatus Hinthialibacter antarcticus]|nr:hypothetical protein [Candidatus Hinthialibacter antarcticus]